MKVFLLRHAEAEPTWPDHERELTPKGQKSIEKLASALKPKYFADVRFIEHSPLTRARQTAEILKQHLPLNIPLQQTEGITPEDNPQALAQALSTGTEDRVIVSHNPFLTLVSNLLLVAQTRPGVIEMRTSSFLCLHRYGPPEKNRPAGSWAIEWHLTGSQIRK